MKDRKGMKGFFVFHKKHGKTYVYLVRAVYKNKKKKNVPLYSFGHIENALNNMFDWRDDFDLFPILLSELGFTWEDLREWILTLETGYSKYGRKLCITDN